MNEDLKNFLGNIARNLTSNGTSCQISSLNVIAALLNANGFSAIKENADVEKVLRNAEQEFCNAGDFESANAITCVLSACGFTASEDLQAPNTVPGRAKRMRSWLGVNGVSGTGHFDDGGGSPESGEGHFGWNR